MKKFLLVTITAILCSGQASPTNPELPRSVPPTSQPSVTGTTYDVVDLGTPNANGASLQSIYTAAACGDKISLQAGVTYRSTNSFYFTKRCTAGNWIQIVSANLASIPVTTYVTQSQINAATEPTRPNTANYAKLVVGSGPTVLTNTLTGGVDSSANYHYFGGLEIANEGSSFLLGLGGSGYGDALTEDEFGDHMIVDRLYFHGTTGSSVQQIPQGIVAHGTNIAIINSYFADLYTLQGPDGNGVLLHGGAGPFLIHNNFIEGGGENIMAGGTGAPPGYKCTVAASPSPTTTTATVNTCVDLRARAVSTPPVGTCVMFYTRTDVPVWTPDDWTCITGNSSGALTFSPAIHSAPLAGADHIQWGSVPSDVTITNNVWFRPSNWNPTHSDYDGVARITCTVDTGATSTDIPVIDCITETGAPHTMGNCSGGCGGAIFGFYVGGAFELRQINSVSNASGQDGILHPSTALSGNPDTGVRKALYGFRISKNFHENKIGARWLIEGNVGQHMFNGGQGGAFNINSTNQNGDCAWCNTSDITIQNNIYQDIIQAFGIIPAQSYAGAAPGQLRRLLIKNNLFWPGNDPTTQGMINMSCYIMPGFYGSSLGTNGAESVQIIHNNIIGLSQSAHIFQGCSDLPSQYTNFVMKDNLVEFTSSGGWTSACGTHGTTCLETKVVNDANYTISNNAVINTGYATISSATTATNYSGLILSPIVESYTDAEFVSFTGNHSTINADYHNYALATGSPFHNAASDSTDPGVNFTTLDAALSGAPSVPVITTSCPLTAATINIGFNRYMVATGSPIPVWDLSTGSLPTGLSLETNGQLHGTPTVQGTSNFTLRATNSEGNDTLECSLTINAAAGTGPTITTSCPLPNGVQNSAYSETMTATGDPTITWDLSTGTLPTGLTLASNGNLTGTPSGVGLSTFTLRATNTISNNTLACSLTINGPPTGGMRISSTIRPTSRVAIRSGGSSPPPPPPPPNGITLLNHILSPGDMGSGSETSPIDTRGATLIVVVASAYANAGSGEVGITDSEGNSWYAVCGPPPDGGHPDGYFPPDPTFVTRTNCGRQGLSGAGGRGGAESVTYLWFSFAPTTSATHTFANLSEQNAATWSVLGVLVFAGTTGANCNNCQIGDVAGIDQYNWQRGVSSSLAPGLVTATLPEQVYVTALATTGTAPYSIDSGFTLVDSATNTDVTRGIGVAYKVVTPASAQNPLWSWTPSGTFTPDTSAAVIATFK